MKLKISSPKPQTAYRQEKGCSTVVIYVAFFCLSLFIGNTVTATPLPTTWDGISWSNGAPTSTVDAIIASSTQITAALTCKNLTINSGVTLTSVVSYSVKVYGDITNNGNGISGFFQLFLYSANCNLTGNPLRFGGALYLSTTSMVFTTNDKLILSSSSTGTGEIFTIAAGASITGNVTQERYIPSSGRKTYTLVSSPVSSPTIYTAWQEGGAATAGYGTQITGASSGNGFDAVSAAGIASIYSYNDNNATGSKWVGLTNTNATTLAPGIGFLLYVRGDRTIQPGSGSVSTTVLRATGTIATGNVDLSSSLTTGANKYSLVANPFTNSISWTTGITKTNLATSFTVYDSNLGIFVSSDGTTKSPNSGNQYVSSLQNGQAFFVQNDASGNAPGLIITTSAKTVSPATSISSTVFGVQTPTAQLNVNFYRADNSFADGAVAVFNANYSKQQDSKDADKFTNFNETVSFTENIRNLSIDARPMPVTDTLQINTTQMAANASYTIAIDGNGFDNTNLYSATLIDKLTGINTNIDLSSITNYSFTTSAANEAGRLLIVLNNKSMATAVDNGNTDLSVKLGANPVADNIIVNYAAKQSANTTVRLINIVGQPLTNINLGVQQQGQVTIPVSQYTGGLYLVEVTIGDKKVIKKVIKE